MKKTSVIFSLLLFFGIPSTFASTGAARDGALFLISLSGLMLLIAALFQGFDYLRKNWQKILTGISQFVKKALNELIFTIN